ncbi:ketimine reductase mu-crystallin-like [Watersipora subatra]|uniref:ketimine reductase mu-crystallin-like n=1 Tax=Watersipora subatra TaxID=2589382 RepID=UPI00355C2B04
MAGVANISAEEVAELLSIDELISVIERGLANYSEGEEGGMLQPYRSIVQVVNPGPEFGFFGSMPFYNSKENILACKVGSFYPFNLKHDKPVHNSSILLYDPVYGGLQAIVDGVVITERRTPAASAVAAKYLVEDRSKPVKLALLGAGTQARSHFQALKCIFNISKVCVWSRTMESAIKCAEEINGEACNTAEKAVENADIIVTVTLSQTPVLQKTWVKLGAIILAVGGSGPDSQEVDPELVKSSVVYTDSKKIALMECGDIIKADAEIYAEIGEVVNGTKPVKRGPTTLFKMAGMQMEDAVSAKLVFDTYRAKKEPS